MFTNYDYTPQRAEEVMRGCTPEAARFLKEAISFYPQQGELLDLVYDSVMAAESTQSMDDPTATKVTQAAQVIYVLEKVAEKGGPSAAQLHALIDGECVTNVAIDKDADRPTMYIDVAPVNGVAPFGQVCFTNND